MNTQPNVVNIYEKMSLDNILFNQSKQKTKKIDVFQNENLFQVFSERFLELTKKRKKKERSHTGLEGL